MEGRRSPILGNFPVDLIQTSWPVMDGYGVFHKLKQGDISWWGGWRRRRKEKFGWDVGLGACGPHRPIWGLLEIPLRGARRSLHVFAGGLRRSQPPRYPRHRIWSGSAGGRRSHVAPYLCGDIFPDLSPRDLRTCGSGGSSSCPHSSESV